VPFRDDLIERTIEQLSQILSRMILHQTSYAELETFVQQTYQKHTGIDGNLLKQLSSQDILSTLKTTGQMDKEKGYLIAALLEAESVMAQQDQEGLRLKALDLYLEAALADAGIEDLHQRIDRLRADLATFVLPEASEWRLFRYVVKREEFDKAETKLFEILEQFGATKILNDEGHMFYKSLLHLSDDDLERGGLPRVETEEGYTDFKSRLLAADTELH
jgi:hypothetical protein